jgi:hypothetical protein
MSKTPNSPKYGIGGDDLCFPHNYKLKSNGRAFRMPLSFINKSICLQQIVAENLKA